MAATLRVYVSALTSNLRLLLVTVPAAVSDVYRLVYGIDFLVCVVTFVSLQSV